MRRLRRALNPRAARAASLPRTKVRYFVAGEYGAVNARPHWHAALFGIEFADLAKLRKSPAGFQLWSSAVLSDAWGLGFCSLGRVTFDSAAYIAGYILNKRTGDESTKYDRVHPHTGEVYQVKPEFSRCSLRPAIGKLWFERYASDCLPRDYCVVEGRKVPVPRYYAQLFKKRDAFAFDDLVETRLAYSALSASERTPERLATREKVAQAASALKSRKL